MITQKQINKYIKDIKKELLYGTKESRQFLKELKQNVTDYAEENQNADMAEGTQQFGKPEEIAATFFEQYSKDDIKRKVNIRRVVVITAVVAIVTFTVYLTVAVVNSYKSVNGAIIDELIEGTTAYVSSDITTNAQG